MSSNFKFSKFLCLLLFLGFSGNSKAVGGFFEVDSVYDFNVVRDITSDKLVNNETGNLVRESLTFTFPKNFPPNLGDFVVRTISFTDKVEIKNVIFSNESLEKPSSVGVVDVETNYILKEGASSALFFGTRFNARGFNDGTTEIENSGTFERTTTVSTDKSSTLDVRYELLELRGNRTTSTGQVFLTGKIEATDTYKLWSITPETQQTLMRGAELSQALGAVAGITGSIIGLGADAVGNNQISALANATGAVLGVKSIVDNNQILSNENALSIAGSTAAYVTSFVTGNKLDPLFYAAFALDSLSLALQSSAVALAYLASDPPDPNYKTLTALNYVPISPGLNANNKELAFTALANNLLNFSDSMRVATSSLEKYQGAIAAKDFEFAQLQLDHFNENESNFLSLLGVLPTDISNFKNSLNEFNILETTPDLQQFANFLQEVKSNPLFLSELDNYLALYHPGEEIDKDSILSLDADAFLLALMNTGFNNQSIGQQLDLLGNVFIDLSENYERVVQIDNPSSVPLPPSVYLMAGGLIGLSLLRKRKSNPASTNYA